MEPVIIQRKEDTEQGWRFIIEIGRHEDAKVGFAVTVDRDYFTQLTLGKHEPERLVLETFKYLLAKETTKTAVVRELGNTFNLKDVSERYYSYERRMKMALFGTEYPEKELS
ncbi:MAG: hypothetical protein Q8P12_08065 [bacterium]|nr:hypothetical protein [bacterium]